MIFDGKTYRNLQDQVGYLTARLDTQELLNEFGLTVLGRVDTFADLPANDPDDPFSYGDAYMVGQEGVTPYRMAIWTRNADGYGNAGWFDIGYFPTAPDEFSIVEVNGEPVHVFNADTKLDKVITATSLAQLYLKAADGSQAMVDVDAGIEAGAVPVRDANGEIPVPDTPQSNSSAVNKGYALANYILKQTGTTSYIQAYIKYPSGTNAMYDASASAIANGIVIRDANIQINAPNQTTNPPSDDQYITKRYADAHYASGVTHYIHRIIVDVTTTSNHQYKMMVSIINSSNTAITGFRGIFSDSSVLSLSVTPLEAKDDEDTRIYWSVSPYYGYGFPYSGDGLGVSIDPSIGAPFIINGLSGSGSAVSTINIVDTVSQL